MALPQEELIKLIGGPYRTPKCRLNGYIECDRQGRVKVKGFTGSRIPWPLGKRKALVRCGDLVRAVKTESVSAVAHWFGVSGGTVANLRREYRIPQFNQGTVRLKKTIVISEEQKRKSRPILRAALEARNALKRWKPEELALLGGRYNDVQVAAMTGRTVRSVGHARKKRGIPPSKARPKYRRWTPEEDRVILKLKPSEAALRLAHRTIDQINSRRQRLLRGGMSMVKTPWRRFQR